MVIKLESIPRTHQEVEERDKSGVERHELGKFATTSNVH